MRLLLTTLSLTLAASTAYAADAVFQEPAPPVVEIVPEAPSFTGLYAGLQGGGAFNPDSGVLNLTPLAGTQVGLDNAFGSNYSGAFDSGFVGGAHIGYDYQFNNFVAGGILDINAADIGDSQSAFSNTPAFYTAERSIDYYGTLRARLGVVAFDRMLVYAHGGGAYGEVESRFNTNTPAAVATTSDSDDFGYVVGGGAEVLVTDNISFGAEYQYVNLGDSGSNTNLVGAPGGAGAGAFGPSGSAGTTANGSDSDFDFHTVQGRISYRF